jgi:hypothetical protein
VLSIAQTPQGRQHYAEFRQQARALSRRREAIEAISREEQAMISVSGSLWPYLLLTLCWIAVCAYFLHRAWKAGGGALPAKEGTASSAQEHVSSGARDTQAGRI